MRLTTIILFGIFISAGCHEASRQESHANRVDSVVRGPVQPSRLTILQLFNESESIDSLVILYFKDKLRFRYYTFYTTTDTSHLSLFKANLTVDTAGNTNCVKDGTIYAYIKGSVYTTLYFAMSDSCRNLRLFKNGKLYNYPLNPPFQSLLRDLKSKSKDP